MSELPTEHGRIGKKNLLLEYAVKPKRNMDISSIVTSYDKPKVTAVHVREVMNSTVLPKEIIVVNDGGDDSLLEMLKALPKKCPIIYAKIREDIPWNYNGACNLGVWLSSGEILAFEDTDNIPHKDCYQDSLQVLGEYPEVGRVIGRIRHDISSDQLEKPQEEWEVTGSRGPNQGSYLIRREIYLSLKGQDERFCGRYGWMYYDWRRRLLGKAKTKFSEGGIYYYVTDAQCGLSHKNSPQNYGYLRQNTKMEHLHNEHGILNFTYEIERL